MKVESIPEKLMRLSEAWTKGRSQARQKGRAMMETKFKFVLSKCCFTCKHYEFSLNRLNGPYMCVREQKEHKIAFPVRLHYCCTGYEKDERHAAIRLEEMYAHRQAQLELEQQERGMK